MNSESWIIIYSDWSRAVDDLPVVRLSSDAPAVVLPVLSLLGQEASFLQAVAQVLNQAEPEDVAPNEAGL